MHLIDKMAELAGHTLHIVKQQTWVHQVYKIKKETEHLKKVPQIDKTYIT